MVDEQFIASWAERLRTEIPNTVAVLLKGSHVSGTAGPHSDVDFDVLVEREPFEAYLAYLVETDTDRIIHVSVAVTDLVGWMADAREVESWAFGLPAQEATRLLWARDAALRTQLDRPARQHPSGDPELEDVVEAFGKVKNARQRNDELALRLAAQGLATLCPSLLMPLNSTVGPTDRHGALLAALAFPVAPVGYREDMLVCLGLSEGASTPGDVHDAARRLVLGVLALLRENADHVCPVLPVDLFGYLMDGTLERYVRQS